MRAARVAAFIEVETGITARLVEGGLGEFSVSVNDRPVARKRWMKFPTDEHVLDAVRAELGRS
ncbi:MAG TPA: hypothetical protein VEY11_03710 [Pyrinomonadaceae bacterium]|nr:hypothetical protein [Pyrinomonadaceae bacterium]